MNAICSFSALLRRAPKHASTYPFSSTASELFVLAIQYKPFHDRISLRSVLASMFHFIIPSSIIDFLHFQHATLSRSVK